MKNTLAVKKIIQSKIKEGFVPYIMGSYDNINSVNIKPFGLSIKKIVVEDINNKVFFDNYIYINGIAFGEKTLGIPRWVGIDCVALPSVTVGFALPFKKLPVEIKRKLDVKDKNQLIPVSEYTLIPKIYQSRKFVNCTLCSVISKNSLASLSVLLGIAIYNPIEIDIVAQFSDISLKTHTKYGNLEIILPKLDIHNLNTSFVGRLKIKSLENICYKFLTSKSRNSIKSTFEYFNSDLETKEIILSNIKNKVAKYYITYPGVVFNSLRDIEVPTLLVEVVL